MKEELLKGLSKEQIAKVKNCKNSEEILKIAKEEGVELTSEQLAAVSGGCFSWQYSDIKCPHCNNYNIVPYDNGRKKCKDCGCIFTYWGEDNYTDITFDK